MKPFETLTSRGQIGRLRRLALQALGQYDIQIARLKSLAHGDNTTFRVDSTDGERYLLRVYRPVGKTVATVRSEMLLLLHLAQDENLVVPQPVATKTGEWVTVAEAESVPEARMCVLLRWINGRFINEGLTPSHLEQVGIFTANLQLRAMAFQPPADFVRGRLDNLYGKSKGLSEAEARRRIDDPENEAAAIQLVTDVCSPEDGALVAQLIKLIRAAQRGIGHTPDVFGIVHGDLHQWNYLFHQGQVRAIDFDDCGYGHYLYDLAVTLYNIQWHDNATRLREAFLAGYRQVRPLSTEHEHHLEIFMALRDLQMMIWAIEMRNHPAFRDSWQSDVDEILKFIQTIVGK
ncbi:MAG: phosphotransferase [Chloroflexota bacterium]